MTEMEKMLKYMKDVANELSLKVEEYAVNLKKSEEEKYWFTFEAAMHLMEQGRSVSSQFWKDEDYIYLHYNIFWHSDKDKRYKLNYKEIKGKWRVKT